MLATQRIAARSWEPKIGKRSAERAAVSTMPTSVVQRTNCACGGACPRCRGQYSPQEKYDASQSGGALAQETDRVAAPVMRNPQSASQDNPLPQKSAVLRSLRYAPAPAPAFKGVTPLNACFKYLL